MSRIAACLLAGLLLGLGSPPASAQQGLYAPFPKPASKERSERFVEALRARTDGGGAPLAGEELERGVFVGSSSASPEGGRLTAPRSPGAVSGRADGSLGGLAGWLAALALAALLALVPAHAARSRA